MKIKLIRLNDFCERYGVGRTRAYELLRQRVIKGKKIGKSILIIFETAEAWAESLPDFE